MNLVAQAELAKCSKRSRHGGAARRIFVGGMRLTGRHVFGGTARRNCWQWFGTAAVTYVHRARTAIELGLRRLGLRPNDEILVPAYHCGSEVDVLLAAGLKVVWYRISRKGEIDADDVRRKLTVRTRALYVIHYFGFPQPLTGLRDWCREHGLKLVEDCALSLLTKVSGDRIGMKADLAIYNFPKTLPVPDGGALVMDRAVLPQGRELLRPPQSTSVLPELFRLFRRSLVGGLPRAVVGGLLAARQEPLPCRLPEQSGSLEMPKSYYFSTALRDRRMSRFSRWMLERIDLDEVRQRRRANYARLVRALAGISGIEIFCNELPDGVCPLFVPVIVSGARHVAHRLNARMIPAIAWWAGYHRDFLNNTKFAEARFLKDNLLALPIHQQLGDAEIDYIGAQVHDCLR